MEQATGYYLNVYGRDVDIFIIFKEPNKKPTLREINIISEIIDEALGECCDEIRTLHTIRAEIKERVEATNLKCIQYGVQVIVQDL